MKTWTGRVECGICGNIQRSLVRISNEHDEPIIPLECRECGNMACTPIYDNTKDRYS